MRLELSIPEFRSQRRHIPLGPIIFLSTISLAYAAVLMWALPWTSLEAADKGLLPLPLAIAFAVSGTALMLRAFVVHALACYEHVQRAKHVPPVMSRVDFVRFL